ncbi:MAG: sulfotransferase [Proteobacteria bacterium]|nr:sulfotransferase [Pseudomonadota bacterium]
MTARVFIHVGVPKSGTSTLQLDVFPKHEEIDFRFWPKRDTIEGLFSCLYGDTLYDDAAFEACARRIAESHAGTEGAVLYSREHLTHQRYDRGTMARRLRRLFGEASIILTIRNQFDWFESSYVWNLRLLREPWRGGVPPGLESYLAGQWRERHRSRLASGDFGALARLYTELFGRERVLVLAFEDMVARPERYAEALFGFLDVSRERGLELLAAKHRNPRLTERRYALWYWRAIGMPMALQRLLYGRVALPGADRLLDAGPAKREPLPERWREELGHHYAPGNRYLEREFGLDLAGHGYPV